MERCDNNVVNNEVDNDIRAKKQSRVETTIALLSRKVEAAEAAEMESRKSAKVQLAKVKALEAQLVQEQRGSRWKTARVATLQSQVADSQQHGDELQTQLATEKRRVLPVIRVRQLMEDRAALESQLLEAQRRLEDEELERQRAETALRRQERLAAHADVQASAARQRAEDAEAAGGAALLLLRRSAGRPCVPLLT